MAPDTSLFLVVCVRERERKKELLSFFPGKRLVRAKEFLCRRRKFLFPPPGFPYTLSEAKIVPLRLRREIPIA